MESLESRRITKILTQSAKLKRLPDHPMQQRMEQPTKGRLKRSSFIHQARLLKQRNSDLAQ
jgi:hypothetical protein